jgi:putative transposase
MREKVREIARKRQRFGHLRITALLRREGLRENHKRIHRICREERLLIPRRRRKGLQRQSVPGSLAITVDTSLPGLRVRRELDRLIALHGKPEELRVDNVLNARSIFEFEHSAAVYATRA